MKVIETSLHDAFVLELETIPDERGWFARSFDIDVLAAVGIAFEVVQASVSHNTSSHTLRGMHWQQAPAGEKKHIRCVRGRAFDVLADVRSHSPTYGRWWARELRAGDGTAVVAPEGVAHGFLTLEPHTEIEYLMSHRYDRGLSTGFRWDDPTFAISWPATPQVMAQRDRSFPDFTG